MEFFELITSVEARQIIEDNISSLQSNSKEKIHITQALDRVTAENVMAPESLPAFTKSVMDGYAVKAEDTFGASEEKPQTLELIGEVRMGIEPIMKLEKGEAAKIPTGGMLSSGADAVVMVEDTLLEGERVQIFKPVSPGQNIVSKGSDIEAGQQLLPRNHQLRPQDIGALAGVGVEEILVYKKTKVGVISTGDELIPLENDLKLGQTRDINTYSLGSLIEELGAITVEGKIVEDEFASLKVAVESLVTEVDFLVISGGSSVGTRDVTYEVLDEIGDDGVLIHGVAVKPGKPTIFTMIDDVPVYGLPGHPVSVMVIFKKFVAPYIKKRMGVKNELNTVKAKFSQNLSSAPGREDYLRVKLEEDETGLVAKPVRGGSSLIMTMVEADGLVKVPLSKEGLVTGEEVEVELL